MRKVSIQDAQTDTTLVFARVFNSVDVYMTSPDKEVNDYMEEHKVIQSYSINEFQRWFPEIFKYLKS
nr:MAG TPA: hypothetical protein [Caudoviricetes sp.]